MAEQSNDYLRKDGGIKREGKEGHSSEGETQSKLVLGCMLNMQGPNNGFGPNVEVQKSIKSHVERRILLECHAETLLVASCGFLKLNKLN